MSEEAAILPPPSITIWWKGLSLPPGQASRFIIGNKDQPPLTFPWLEYARWSKVYDTVLHSHSKSWVVQLSYSAQQKSPQTFSNLDTINTPTDPKHDAQWPKRASHQELQTYTGRGKSGALERVSRDTNDFINHFRRNATAFIMKAAYGYSVAGKDDQIIQIIQDGMKHSGPVNVPRKFWVEALPILRFIPVWFLGAGFKRFAKKVEKLMDPIQTVPFEWAVKNILTGTYIESYSSKALRVKNGKIVNGQVSLKTALWTSSAFYVGGVETTVATLTTLMFVMYTHPEVQKKAQAEIDKVAPHRLPTLDNLDSLPYIVAIVKETVRYGTIVPLGLPHQASEDDVYERYFIPKGLSSQTRGTELSFHCIDAIAESIYIRSHETLGSSPQPDPFKFIFDFGRRVCPGAHLAQMSFFLDAMSILAVFDILKPLNEDRTEVEPKEKWQTGVFMWAPV